MTRRSFPLALITLCASISACTKTPKQYIDRLEVDAFEGGEVISLTEEQLRVQLTKKLEGAKFVVLSREQKAPEDVKPWRLDFAAGLTEPGLEEGNSWVSIALDVRHTGDAEPIALTSRIKVGADGHDVEAMQTAIRGALDDGMGLVVREAAAIISLEGASADVLLAKRKDADAATREAAVRLLVRKGDRRVLPDLLERLKSDELDELRATIGLLVELKATESVNPLIEASNQRDPMFQREVVFAVGSIGGSDAEAYLDLVASGHDDPILRASAEQALSELRARNAKKNPPPPAPGTNP
ncbi:MAG: HEAT repeat domain-containing protein [Archangium sp.]